MKMIFLAFLVFSCGPQKKEKTVIIQGEQGEQGVPGEKGEKGDTGSQGSSGRDGVGLQGETGQMGPQGPSGRDGSDGRDGSNGMNGRDGTNGMNGQDGQDGHNGETIIVPQPKYAAYCYGFKDVYNTTCSGECGGTITTTDRYHIFYNVYTMPNGDVFGRLCEGYKATLNSCENGLLTTKTWTIGDQAYSTAPLQSRYLSARLTGTRKAEIKGKDWVQAVTCTDQP